MSYDEASQACQGGGGVDRDSKSQNYDGYDVGHTGLVSEDRFTQEPELRVRDYIMNDLNRYIKKFWPKSSHCLEVPAMGLQGLRGRVLEQMLMRT